VRKMRAILFAKTTDPLADDLAELVRSVDHGSQVEVYRTVESLELRLRSTGVRPGVVLLSVPDRDTLEALLGIEDLLKGAPLVEVLADHSGETLDLAHRLRPRYLHDRDTALKDLGAVLEKMARTA
jgi:hypothetical protein